MKKIISLILILVLCTPLSALAAEKYISITPYPLSSHILGEDLVIYAETNLSLVVIGLYYPVTGGYNLKFHDVVYASDLKKGYTIPTSDEIGKKNPEGKWKLLIQYGNVSDEINIPMTSEPVYNRYVRIAEYSDNTLTHIRTYTCRGIEYSDKTISFSTEDGKEIRIFSWDNLSPTDSGETQLFIATYEDDYMTDIRTYRGELCCYGNHTTLNSSASERLEIYYWHDNLIPVS